MYFSVGNRAKIGVGGFGVTKYSFWGPKRHRFSHQIFFKILQISQNDVVLDCESLKRRRFELVVTYPKQCLFGLW